MAEAPVNAVAMSPVLDHVVVTGGQDVGRVTTTGHRAGMVESKFFDKFLEKEIGVVRGHFAPINTLAFNPDGKSFSSRSEDGFVRLNHFDPSKSRLRVLVLVQALLNHVLPFAYWCPKENNSLDI